MSKYIVFDFRCRGCKAKFEGFVKPDVKTTSCPNCSCTADRLISTPTIGLSGTDPDFPSSYDKWEKTQKQKRDNDKKFYKEHGVDKLHHSVGS